MVSQLQNDAIDNMRQALIDTKRPVPEKLMSITDFRGNLAPANRAAFIFAGNATFTIKSPSGTRFTYKVHRAKHNPKYPIDSFFVEVLSGPDSYQDLGRIADNKRHVLHPTRNTKMPLTAPSWVAFTWFLIHLDDVRIEVWHEGSCGRCGRALTVPESIESGIGPICAEKGL